jgi:hypothetical protein
MSCLVVILELALSNLVNEEEDCESDCEEEEKDEENASAEIVSDRSIRIWVVAKVFGLLGAV